METCITTRAPAKINVTLEVIGKLSDDYHHIRSVLVKLHKLADVIEIRIGAAVNGITISSDNGDLPLDEKNICYRAARGYLRAAGETAGVHVHIRKKIPIAAGLGGGSSDAAAVLMALNNHFGKCIPAEALQAMGSDLGKDVPFFLGKSKTGHVCEKGDRVKALPAFPRADFLIVNPRVPISTRDAYRSLAGHVWFMSHEGRFDRSQQMVKAIAAGDLTKVAAALYNDFEALGERAHPVIKEIKQALIAFGANGALMSGSGSTVFGLFASRKALLRAEAALRAHYPDFIIAVA